MTGGYEWPWIAASAAMTGGRARFIAPLQKTYPCQGRGRGMGAGVYRRATGTV